MPEVFPLTIGSGKTKPFEKRHVGCEEREKINRRRIYDTLRINFFEATTQTACIFSKGDKNNPQGLRVHKHIFVGNSRLVTAMTHTDNNGDNAEQREKRYYYHSDHLGSAQFVTDWRGKQYEHIEYTPYGELWIEEVAAGLDKLPFRFTGKEMDEETGLYYYGARYLDPKYSRWLSGDPALGDYIPKAPVDDEAKKHNENLPGMGGVYNTVNLHLYHYAGNNPVKDTDPDGKANKPILNLHTPKSKDFTYSNGFKIPENTFVVAAHGNVYGVYDHRGNESHRVKPKELAAMIKSHPGYKNGMTVMLLVCNVGLPGPDGTISAQQIADAMGEGERVRAPEGFVNMYQHPFGRKKGQIDYFVQKKGEPIDTLNTELKEFIGKPKKEEVKE